MPTAYTPLASPVMRPRSSRLWTVLLLCLGITSVFLIFNPRTASLPHPEHIPHLPHLPHLAYSPPPDPYHPQIAELFPQTPTYNEAVWQDRNARTMHGLMACLKTNTCHQNQTRVVLLGSHHFYQFLEGALAGENIWANSIISALSELGYSYLFSRDTEEAIQQYRMMPNLVVSVILEPGRVKDCFHDRTCLKSSTNPLGIPFWKLFGFHWWNGDAGHPLGKRWTISPEKFHNGIFYLGYSVEKACKQRAYVPFADRPQQAYILAKKMSYFYKDTYPWTDDAYAHVAAQTGAEFVIGMWNDTDFASHLPPATRNLGSLSQTQFFEAVARSKVLVGIGQPFLSPSPWDALCLGVPFVNPVHWYDHAHPEDKSRWVSQHDPMMRLGEPWVYTMLKGDTDAFEKAMARALSTPIEPYIHPDMTHDAMRARMAYFLDYDWYGLGMEDLANRTRDGREVYVP